MHPPLYANCARTAGIQQLRCSSRVQVPRLPPIAAREINGFGWQSFVERNRSVFKDSNVKKHDPSPPTGASLIIAGVGLGCDPKPFVKRLYVAPLLSNSRGAGLVRDLRPFAPLPAQKFRKHEILRTGELAGLRNTLDQEVAFVSDSVGFFLHLHAS